MPEIILKVIAGLVLFLFAVGNLSETLKSSLSHEATNWIKKFTSGTFSSLAVGIVTTILLDSSSALIIIIIVLVNSNVLTLRRAMGVVLGANIGTTISSQIIAMDITKYAPVFLLVGFILMVISASEKVSQIGKVILYFGILFFGLFTIGNAVEPLKDEAFVYEWMRKAENPFLGGLIGVIVTLVIQSSSATVGVAIMLTKQGLLSLTGGVAVMLGSELGTCSDTLLATIKGSRQALKTGLFHIAFNLLSIIIALALFQPFVDLVDILSRGATMERTLANAQLLFNVFGVLIFVWTIPTFEKILNRLLPDKPNNK